MNAAKELGIRVSNVAYSPYSVADFTVMLMLMINRQIQQALLRNACHDYSLQNLIGHELRNQTVGILGTGRIGRVVAKNLSGFGCKIIAHDLTPDESLTDLVEYVEFDTLLAQSDLLTLHIPLWEQNYHLINETAMSKMKDRVKFINAARGEIVDSEALIQAISDMVEYGLHSLINSLQLEKVTGNFNIHIN